MSIGMWIALAVVAAGTWYGLGQSPSTKKERPLFWVILMGVTWFLLSAGGNPN